MESLEKGWQMFSVFVNIKHLLCRVRCLLMLLISMGKKYGEIKKQFPFWPLQSFELVVNCIERKRRHWIFFIKLWRTLGLVVSMVRLISGWVEELDWIYLLLILHEDLKVARNIFGVYCERLNLFVYWFRYRTRNIRIN